MIRSLPRAVIRFMYDIFTWTTPPEVGSNVDVSAGELVGYVGSDGAFIGDSRVPHLHMDINTIKATGGGRFTTSNTIDPMLFYPDVTFSRVSTRTVSFVDVPEQAFNPNEHIDTYLIRYVGEDRFDQWVKTTSGKVNIDSFKEQFNISEQQFQSLISTYGISNLYM